MTRGHSVHAVAACCWLLSASAAWAQPLTGTVSPYNGSGNPGTPQTIAITASDSGGWQNISHLDVLINSVGSGTNACFFVYFPNLNAIYLEHDIPDSGWAPGYADVGNHTGSASNSHCTIYGSGSSTSQSGSLLTLTFNVSFSFPGGTLYYWEHVVGNDGDSGWFQIIIGGSPASFLVQAPNQPPTVGTVTPATETIAANTSTMLQFTGSDPNGSPDVAEMDVVINSVPDGSTGCFWIFLPYQNAVYLVPNSGPWLPVGVNGNTTYPNPASSSTCTVSPSGSTSSGASLTETLNLNLSFPSSFAGAKSYWEQVKDQSNATSNWQQIAGSVTVNPPSASVQLSVAGETGTVFRVGDTFSVSVMGPTNQAVALSLNGGAISAPVGYTNGQGIWSTSGTWGAGDVGDYTETWYVGSAAAVPGLSFQVSSTGAPLSCGGGFIGLNDFPPGAQTIIRFTASGASSVVFNISGANTNPYTSSLAAARSPGSPIYFATLDTTGLLGAYSIAAVITASNGSRLTCKKDFFSVIIASPSLAPQATCASMTGTWTDSIGGAVGTWNLTDNGGAITGRTTANICGTNLAWDVSGSYTASTQNLSLTATNGSPSVYTCGGIQFGPADHSFTSTGSGGAFLRPNCGKANGLTFKNLDTGVTLTGQTLTVSERIPAGETSVFSSWADAYGHPTAAVFNMTLNVAPGGSAYNFGGRTVTQNDPAPGDTLPDGFSSSDGCYWSGAPWPTPFTSLAKPGASWNVQNGGSNGGYGPDYIEMGGTITGWIQNYAPAMVSGSCTIKFPQKMVINRETVGTPEPYGAAQSGLNLLVFTFTPTSISVARGSASMTRTFYY
jgi:hypothetical protein